MKKILLIFITSLFAAGGCTSPISVSPTPLPPSPALTELPQPLITKTLDPNQFTVSTEIDKNYSQEEIAEILFSKWLDHFLSENIGPEMRINEYTIDKIDIPVDQKCASRLGGLFIAEAQVTAETFLPLISTTDGKHSGWFIAGGGNIINDYHQRRTFTSVIYQSGDTYTLSVITRVPMCN